MTQENMLILALQKSGRLNKQSVQLLKDCGISFVNGSNNLLKVTATNFPIQILYDYLQFFPHRYLLF